MTLDQAKQLRPGDMLHAGTCTVTIGPRGGRKESVEVWKVNGRVKTWKRDPSRIQIPIKHGMWDFHYVTETNLDIFHLAGECAPAEVKP